MSVKLDTTCPVCHSKNDGHSSVDDPDARPSDGDISLCAYCGTLGTYSIDDQGNAKVVQVSDEVAKELLTHPDIQRAVAMARAFRG